MSGEHWPRSAFFWNTFAKANQGYLDLQANWKPESGLNRSMAVSRRRLSRLAPNRIGLHGAERVDEAHLVDGGARHVEQARAGYDDGEVSLR